MIIVRSVGADTRISGLLWGVTLTIIISILLFYYQFYSFMGFFYI